MKNVKICLIITLLILSNIGTVYGYVEKQFNISMNEPAKCTPGVTNVRGTDVYKCNENATEEILISHCSNGILEFDGKGNFVGCNVSAIYTKATPGFNSILSVIVIMSSFLIIHKRR